MSNPFWEYSKAHYARDGVARACLSLQDEHGLDVNMLLYAAWLASEGRRADRGHIEALSRDVGPWRERVIEPLRSLRRQWRDYGPVSPLRDRLKDLELEAERVQQDRMLAFYRASPPPHCDTADVETNLCLVAESTLPGPDGWGPAVRRLSRLLAP
jgi:uncharacterized protein (TIGR02444 family)